MSEDACTYTRKSECARVCIRMRAGPRKYLPSTLALHFVGFSTQGPSCHHVQVTGWGSRCLSVLIGATQEECLGRECEDGGEMRASFDDRKEA